MKNSITGKRPGSGMNRLQPLLVVCAALCLTALALPMTLATPAPTPAGRPQILASPDAVPEGLSEPEWASIRQQYEQHRHAAFAVEGGYRARNPGQQWQTRFDGRGFITQPDGANWQWGLELKRYGFPGHEQEIAGQPLMNTTGQRVTYDWDPTLQEWFVNDRRGLEHGFTVKDRPEAAPALNAQPATLNFTLAVRGGLRPEVQADGRNVRFVDAQGAATLTYSGLTVFDADGRKLPAHFESVASARGVYATATPESKGTMKRSEDRAPQTDTALLRLVIDERGARYPLTIDPIAQQAYLKASNPEVGDQFGYSVAVSGDTVVVGAPWEDSSATGVDGYQNDNSAQWAGAAYVFVRNGNTWSQQAYLKASNTDAGDWFGSRVAISGDTVVVAVSYEASNATGINGDQSDKSAREAGAVFVFVRNGNTWTQQAYLKASNTEARDYFGRSVSLSGDTLVVGAHWEDSNATGINGDQSANSATNSGAAYVFVRNGTTWSQQAYLKASNTGNDDQFGQGVGVSGDTVVVGSPLEDSNATGVNGDQNNNSAANSGAAYVFVRNGSTWSQQAYLKASNTDASDFFGSSVAISGDTVVVGAYFEDSSATGVDGNQSNNSAANSGAAYVFVRNGTNWSQQAYLKASNTEAADGFGISVGVSGETVVVGAFNEDSNATGVDSDQSNNSAVDSGAAYVFVRSGTNWTQHAYLKASNTDGGDVFGLSVSVSGGTVVVGALGEDSRAAGVDGDQRDNNASISGAAYIFSSLGIPRFLPAVKASRSGDSLVISWPASANDCQLESTASVGTGSVWENVATPPVVIGDEQVVIVDIGPGSQFFRLRKP